MTDLDQNALDAACKAFAAGRYGSAQATASERDQVTGAITAYLAKRREQGYVLIYNPSVAAYDAVMERAEADTARSISEIVTAAVEKEREACARIADAYADENITMAGDSVLHDPVLSGEARTVANIKKSNDLMIEGCIHSSMFHASQNIAASIRSRSSQAEK